MRQSLLEEMSFNIMAPGCFFLIFILISVQSQTSTQCTIHIDGYIMRYYKVFNLK